MNESKRFLTLNETAKQTGLSLRFLRQGIQSGLIPFIKCGNRSLINYPKLIAILDKVSEEGQVKGSETA